MHVGEGRELGSQIGWVLFSCFHHKVCLLFGALSSSLILFTIKLETPNQHTHTHRPKQTKQKYNSSNPNKTLCFIIIIDTIRWCGVVWCGLKWSEVKWSEVRIHLDIYIYIYITETKPPAVDAISQIYTPRRSTNYNITRFSICQLHPPHYY